MVYIFTTSLFCARSGCWVRGVGLFHGCRLRFLRCRPVRSRRGPRVAYRLAPPPLVALAACGPLPWRRTASPPVPGSESPVSRSPVSRSPGSQSPGSESPVSRSPVSRSPVFGLRVPSHRFPGSRSPGARITVPLASKSQPRKPKLRPFPRRN